MKEFLRHVAPKPLVQQDMAILKSYDKLDTTPEIEKILFMQSLEGRAHNGAGAFDKRTYVNTTIDDIVRSLGENPRDVKAARQKMVDDIHAFVEDVMNGVKRDRLTDADGRPFLGIPMFKDRKVNARDVLRGIYIGGLRDNPDVRRETEKKYHIRIGFGKCYLVDTRVMVAMRLDGEKLAHEAHEDRIQNYIEEGLIVQSGLETQGDEEDHIRYFYIRYQVGPGQSDDAALVTAGVLYNIDVALGVFLADCIDTLEKYAPAYKEQDQELAYYIGRGFKDLGISMDDVYEIAYLAAIPEAEEELVPDSSLRYLLSVDARTNRTALQTHLAFIEGRPIAEIPISFKRIMSPQFYSYIKRRLVNARKLEAMSIPDELAIEELNRPAGELVNKQYVVVPRDLPLKDVIKKFRDSKAEIIIVVDNKNNVVGTLSATDIIHLAH